MNATIAASSCSAPVIANARSNTASASWRSAAFGRTMTPWMPASAARSSRTVSSAVTPGFSTSSAAVMVSSFQLLRYRSSPIITVPWLLE